MNLTVIVLLVMVHNVAAAFAIILIGHQVRQGDIGRASNRTRARRGQDPEVAAAGTAMSLGIRSQMLAMACMVWRAGKRLAMRSTLRPYEPVLVSSFQQNATLLGAIGRRRSQTASDRRQPPFLDVGLDENESSLSKVDVHRSRTVGADRRKEVLCLQTVDDLLQLLAVSCEEDGTGSRTVPNPNYVTLHKGRPIRRLAEWLVVATVAR
jgi:hypothetical protein